MTQHQVVIEVKGGVATVLQCPPDVQVFIRDLDTVAYNGVRVGCCRECRDYGTKYCGQQDPDAQGCQNFEETSHD